MGERIIQTAGRDQLGDFAPDFARYNDEVLFGEVWSSGSIDLRTRCIVTVTALVSVGVVDSSLTYHLRNAKERGVTREEIAAVLTHVAFYAGWPKAWAAFRQAKEVWGSGGSRVEAAFEAEMPPAAAEPARAASANASDPAGAACADAADPARAAHAASMLFPIGEPNDAFAAYFSGKSYLASVAEGPLPIHNVTFEPGCRNNWHIHHAEQGGGQVLVCVGGRGFYQEWGRPAIELLPGESVTIPAGVKHWHGAAPDSWFSHLAIAVPGSGASNEWLEPVDDATYGSLRS